MPEATAKTEYFVGIDLGGTKILAGVFDEKLACLGRNKMSTKSDRGPEEVIDRIARCVVFYERVAESLYLSNRYRLVGICAGCGIIHIDSIDHRELPGRQISADEPGEEFEE